MTLNQRIQSAEDLLDSTFKHSQFVDYSAIKLIVRHALRGLAHDMGEAVRLERKECPDGENTYKECSREGYNEAIAVIGQKIKEFIEL